MIIDFSHIDIPDTWILSVPDDLPKCGDPITCTYIFGHKLTVGKSYDVFNYTSLGHPWVIDDNNVLTRVSYLCFKEF